MFAVRSVKESRLCRLLCGRAQPFRTAGLRLNSLGSAACRKAAEGVKKSLKTETVSRKDAKSQSKQRNSGFRIFAPWRPCVMAFHFFTASQAFRHSKRRSRIGRWSAIFLRLPRLEERAVAEDDAVRCDACPVLCYIKPGRTGPATAMPTRTANWCGWIRMWC